MRVALQNMTTKETHEKLDEFLAPTKIAIVATINKEGMPHLTPNWYIYHKGKISISTTKERVKYKNLTHDNRMSICVLTEPLAKVMRPLREPCRSMTMIRYGRQRR